MPAISNITIEKLFSELEGECYFIVDNDVGGLNENTVKVPLKSFYLLENKTVNLDNSMSASEIQALIDAQPKFGADLTFQFADGTYTMDQGLLFTGFYNRVFILGNASNTSLVSTKAVHLDFSTAGAGVLGITCKSNRSIYAWYLQVTTPGGGNEICINMEANLQSDVRHCAGACSTNTNSRIINSIYTKSFVYNNYLGLCQWGIYSGSVGEVVSHTNDDGGGGAQPGYGLYASAGVIMKQTATTQPAGSTSNEGTGNGGVIR